MAEELTLKKFEEAYEIIKRLYFLPILLKANISASRQETRYISSLRTCSLQVHTRSEVHTTRSAH